MPYLEIKTTVEVSDTSEILNRSNEILSEVLGKSIDYCMSSLEGGADMVFRGENERVAFLFVRSIGMTPANAKELSERLCALMQERIGITPEHCYLQLEHVDRALWGWNGGTFA